MLLSLLLGSPIPRRWVFVALSLVREQWRIGKSRSPDRFSYLEGSVLSRGIAAASAKVDQAARRLSRLVAQADTAKAAIAVLRADLMRLDEYPIVGVRGELIMAREAAKRMASLTDLVAMETEAGSLKPRRVPLRLKRLAPWATLLDLPVLFWFVGSVFNVDWTNLFAPQSIVSLLASSVFALLGTIAMAFGLCYFGHDLKGYKGDAGEIRLPKQQAKTLPLLYLVLSALVACGAAVTMAYRIVSESVTAGNGWLAAAVLGLFFACIVLMVNVVVFAVHYRDGSVTTDELDHLSGQLAPIETQRRNLLRRVDKKHADLEAIRSQAKTIRSAVHNQANSAVVGAHQLIMLARSYHQGCSWSTELLTPEGNVLGLIAPLTTIDLSVPDELMSRLDGDEPSPDGKSDEP
ncbi:hypothetical protein [Nocardia sp. CC201C]|uniref:hypothetical protein n=1 Tax=Nocardia sp. CC201C TaxID=3044575 RepID=UPI0024A8BDEC|nr:hypothetical protein [Nocardia sp. CC201C]